MSSYVTLAVNSAWRQTLLGVAIAASLIASKHAIADVAPQSYVQGSANSAGSAAAAKLLSDAQAALKGGNIRLALIDLKNAVSAAPKNGAVRAQLGILLLQTGDAPSAERELRQARSDGALDALVLPPLLQTMLSRNEDQLLLDQFPDSGVSSTAPAAADVLKARALALQSLGRAPEAIDAMDRSLKLRRDAPGLLTRARLALQQGNSSAAQNFTDDAIQNSPSSPDAIIFKVQLLMAANDNAGALELSNQLVAKFPDNLTGRFARVAVLLRLNQDAKAKIEVDSILAKNPGVAIGNYYKALLMARAGDKKGAWGLAQTLPSDFTDAQPGIAVMVSQMAENAGNVETGASILNRVLLKTPDRVAVRVHLAAIRLKQNSFGEALNVLEPIKNSSDPSVMELLSQIYLGMHRNSDALASLTKLDIGGNGSATVKLEIQMGRSDQAIKDLTEAVSKEPTNPILVAPLINSLLQARRLPEALAVADKLGSDPKQRVAALIYRGDILMLQHDEKGAQAAFDKALQIEPNNITALYSRADLLEFTQRYAEANRDLHAITAGDPKNVAAFLKMAEIAARQGEDQNVRGILGQAISLVPENPVPRIALVRYLASRRDINGALTAVNDLLRTQPNNSDGVALLGELELAQGKKKEAVTTLRRLVTLAPSTPSAQLRLANALIAIGDAPNAALAFNAAVKISPNAPDVMAAQINFQLSQGKVDAALAMARSFQTSNPGSDADLLLADTLLKAKHADQAEAVLRKSLADKPSSQTLLNLVRVAILSNDKKRAEDIMANWLDGNPNDIGVRSEYATLLMQDEDNTKAIAQYQMVLKQDQNNVAAMNNLGWLLQNSNPKQALLLLSTASKLSPDSADVADTLGWIKIQQKDIVGGLALLKQAHSVQPKDGEITYHLVVGLNANANHDAARGLLKALLASGAKFKDQPAAMQLAAVWH